MRREKLHIIPVPSWKMIVLLAILFVSFCGPKVFGAGEDDRVKGTTVDLGKALQFLREYDTEASNMCFRVSSAQWSYSTNMTDFNKRRMIEEQTLQLNEFVYSDCMGLPRDGTTSCVQATKAKFNKVTWRKAIEFDWTRIPDPMVRRQIRMLVTNNRASLSDEKYNEIYHLISEMKDLYAHVRICPYTSNPKEEAIYCDLELEDAKRIMEKSRDNMELLHIWTEFHDKAGPPMRNKFMRYVELANRAARQNDFSDAGEEMESVYEATDFEDQLAESFQKILSLYKELFAYVRSKLYKKYGPDVVRADGPLPVHILGNLWGQDWSGIYDIVAPYPEFGTTDVSDELLRQGFTPLRMFQMGEEFYTSLGLKPMTPEFWRFSMIERPNSRKVQCTASAWDFCNKIDYRIKQCTEVNMENLITTHHEMAHIEYYMYYADQPYLYRDGANPGFHEGVANAITLSVLSPNHLYRMGLTNNNTEVYERNINFLMHMALKKVAYAPFAYLVDQWRYLIFEQGVAKLNSDWWNLRLRFQGIVPPTPRSESHFDAASKRHIPADIPYVKYYVALLLEFQIHKAMCVAAGHVGPLHMCDVYRSREAGRVLSDILRVGKARHWKDVIKMLTRGQSTKLSAEALLEYFQPLLLYLQSSNKEEPVIGWMTKKEDVALYQPLMGSVRSASSKSSSSLIVVYSVIILYHYLVSVLLD